MLFKLSSFSSFFTVGFSTGATSTVLDFRPLVTLLLAKVVRRARFSRGNLWWYISKQKMSEFCDVAVRVQLVLGSPGSIRFA